jgi:hypothetical protein
MNRSPAPAFSPKLAKNRPNPRPGHRIQTPHSSHAAARGGVGPYRSTSAETTRPVQRHSPWPKHRRRRNRALRRPALAVRIKWLRR